jgi:patatin-like phospholipase/acyl hydrolase
VARTRILSIDGGGIRGLIPALVLAELERRAAKPVSELFDLIAGTSTGGILACGLTLPGEGVEPRYTAAELVEFYEREGPGIFTRSLGKQITSLGGVIDERYPSEPLREALERAFGDARLRDARTRVLVPAYEIERRTPWFFRSVRALADPAYDFAMAEVALATSAAPTYFEPVKLQAPNADRDYYALVDGGVFAVNPGMCAWAEARALDLPDDTVVVSLGTGSLIRRIPYDDAKDWGLLEWAQPVLDVVFDGSSAVVDYQLDQVLGEDRHFRLQTPLQTASDDLDDASEENLRALRLEGERLVERSGAELDQAVALLLDG